MGGIGLGMADWLLAHGAGQVVITGRSPARAQGEKLARFGAAVSRVRYVQADIASKAEMSALFEELSAMPGGLRGIFHAAGISIPQDLRDADRDSFDRVLRPKVDGAWLLHELSLGLELEFFAMCSTIACVWGSQHRQLRRSQSVPRWPRGLSPCPGAARAGGRLGAVGWR